MRPAAQSLQLFKQKFVVNVKTSGSYKVLNVIDEELIGKKLNEGGLSVYLDPNYFSGKAVDEDELKELIKENNIINIVGNRSISFVLSLGYGAKEAIRIIDGVGFLIIYKFTDNYK